MRQRAMISLNFGLCAAGMAALVSASAQTGFVAAGARPNHRIWQKVERYTVGEATYARTNEFTEIASGLNAWSENQQRWVEADEELIVDCLDAPHCPLFHIVAQGSKHHKGIRKKLSGFRPPINVDDAVNGVSLPTRYHELMHTETYYNWIKREAATWNTREDAIAGLNAIADKLLKISGKLK